MKDENVLKHPKNAVRNNNNVFLLSKFIANNIPKKKDAAKLIIDVFLILNPKLIFKLFCISILSNNPKVLPNKTTLVE